MIYQFIHGAAVMTIIVTLCAAIGILHPIINNWIGFEDRKKPRPHTTKLLLACAVILIAAAGAATATYEGPAQ